MNPTKRPSRTSRAVHPATGPAARLYRTARAGGMSREEALALLKEVTAHPEQYADHPVYGDLAYILVETRDKADRPNDPKRRH